MSEGTSTQMRFVHGGRKRRRGGRGVTSMLAMKKARTTGIKGVGKDETKYVDGYLDYTAIHEIGHDETWADCELNPRQQTAVYGCLPMPRQGDNYSDRDGRKIYVKHIFIKGVINVSQANTVTQATNNPIFRIIVVKDTRTNGTSLSAENVMGPGLGSDGQATLTSDSGVQAFSSPDGWGRYEIVKDRTFKAVNNQAFNDGTDGAVNGYAIPFRMKVKCNCYVNFCDTPGAIASVIDNSWHVIGAVGNGLNPNISYQARTAFVG